MFCSNTIILSTLWTIPQISPSTQQTVPAGGTRTFTIEPAQNYILDEIRVDGEPKEPTTLSPITYTFTNVQQNHEIHVTFKEMQPVTTFTVISDERDGAIAVPKGGPWEIDARSYAVISFDSRPGHILADVLVNGISRPEAVQDKYIRLPLNDLPPDENGRYEVIAVGAPRENQIRVDFTADLLKDGSFERCTQTPCVGTVPLAVRFNSEVISGTPETWAWDFGNGERGETPRTTYTMPGLYTVSLTGKQGDLSGTETKIGYIYVEQNMPA